MRGRTALVAVACVACGGAQTGRRATGADPLLGWVPADAWFVAATLEPVPFEVIDMYKRFAEPAFDKASGPDARPGERKFLEALAGMATWSREGLEELGLEPSPRFVMYVSGETVVARIVVRDEARVKKAAEHLATAFDEALPKEDVFQGRRYWRSMSKKGSLRILGFVDGQFVFAAGPAAEVTGALPSILVAPPARAMPSSGLRDVATAHGYNGIVGVLHTQAMLTALVGRTGGTASPACTAEIARFAERTPRAVGSMGLSTKDSEMRLAVDLAPAEVAELRALRSPLPGLAGELAQRRLLTIGAAIDLPGAHGFVLRWFVGLDKLAEACAWPGVRDATNKVIGKLGRPIPEPFVRMRSLFASLRTLAFDARGLSPRVEGFATLGVPTARELLEMAQQVPQIRDLGIVADGELHELPNAIWRVLPIALPLTLFVAADDERITIAVDPKGAEMARRVSAAGDRRPAPFITVSGDYSRILELIGTRPGADDEARREGAQAKHLGRAEMILDVRDHGLEFVQRYDLK